MVGVDTLADLPLRGLLERLAARTPAPGGGSACAVTCALAAALVEMAARFGGSEVDVLVERAVALRERALGLAQSDLTSYAPVLEAMRRARDDPRRAPELAAALSAAAGTPLQIAQVGAEVAALAEEAAARGSRHLTGDAATAAALAEAACRAAALLVSVNLRGTADPRRETVGEMCEKAHVALQHALAQASEC